MRYIVFLFVGVVAIQARTHQNPMCAIKPQVNTTLQKLQKYQDQQFRKFSNRKEVASKADAMLSKLLAAKSKVILSWMQRRNLNTASETEIVLQWRKYYAEKIILGQYPNSDKNLNKMVENLINDVYRKFFPDKIRKRLDKQFNLTKSKALERIAAYKMNPKIKVELEKRISKIKLYWMEDFKASKYKKQPLEVFSWGIAYDPVANEINMGIEALQYSNAETFFAVFAHEVGHSFDPCRWGAFFKSPSPFEKIVTCLRHQDSVGALKRDDSKMELFVKKGKLSKDLATALKLNPTCNKLQYPAMGVQADQIQESFADWFATEVIAETGLVTKGLRSDLCREKALSKGSSYPSNKDRLERIYLAHPKIKKTLNYDGKVKYCKL